MGMLLTTSTVCIYVRIRAHTHRLSHAVALWWLAMTAFDPYLCELGQLRNSGWC
jgi:hypothetical protein